jgi:hypothetical protein
LDLNAELCASPLLTAHQSENPPTTLTGDDLFVVVLSPSLPSLPDPHAHALPPARTAKLCPPALTVRQSENPPTTLTGDDAFVVELFPN